MTYLGFCASCGAIIGGDHGDVGGGGARVLLDGDRLLHHLLGLLHHGQGCGVAGTLLLVEEEEKEEERRRKSVG